MLRASADRCFTSSSTSQMAHADTSAAMAAAVVLCLTTLMGCDSRRISELEEGVSTEADVRKRFREPGLQPSCGFRLQSGSIFSVALSRAYIGECSSALRAIASRRNARSTSAASSFVVMPRAVATFLEPAGMCNRPSRSATLKRALRHASSRASWRSVSGCSMIPIASMPAMVC